VAQPGDPARGGEATLLRVDQIENMQAADVIRVFHEARDPEYRALDLAIRGLLGAHPDDQDVLTHGLALFEGLYAGASCKG